MTTSDRFTLPGRSTLDTRIAALPMYDYPELTAAHDALWTSLAGRLTTAGIAALPRALSRSPGHTAGWRHPRLLLGQGCEYPLATSFAGCVRFVATPRYAAAGCEGARYRSAIVVRGRDSATTLADLRHRRCVINEPESNSGMNLLRAAIAPLAGGTRFFESVTLSGSHRRSAELVAAGEADVAALDCVSFAHFRRLYPAWAAELRILEFTPASPSLPFITAAATDATTLHALRTALADVLAAPDLAGVCGELLLQGIDVEPDESCREVLALRHDAVALGYPELI